MIIIVDIVIIPGIANTAAASLAPEILSVVVLVAVPAMIILLANSSVIVVGVGVVAMSMTIGGVSVECIIILLLRIII